MLNKDAVIYDGKRLSFPTDSPEGKAIADSLFQILCMLGGYTPQQQDSLRYMAAAVRKGRQISMQIDLLPEDETDAA